MQNKSKPRILIIDDNAGFRELLRIMLSNEGYAVQEAEDAVEGGKAMLAGQLDLVICDIDMPYMDGLELLSALRSDPATASLKVILVSGRKDNDTLIKAEQFGALDFLVKPVTRERLLESIVSCLNRANGKSSLLSS
ncbi:MAG: response regulator [Pseudomonadota bacterium]